ncbi:hypothetical protein MKZ25_15580 [Solibacillus sp. FSL W7-1464]|uniref:hypothetical protein n=1 Tax=unclassified Solibacillus TaxID=2637870 RepID=UPI0030F7C4B0
MQEYLRAAIEGLKAEHCKKEMYWTTESPIQSVGYLFVSSQLGRLTLIGLSIIQSFYYLIKTNDEGITWS